MTKIPFPAGLKRAAAICILRNNDRFLLLCRSNTPNKGMFVPVGGKLEPFESPQQAVVREVREETGLDITSPKYCGLLTETAPNTYNWICYVYLADIADIEPPFCNEGTLHWVSFSDILSVPTPPTDWWIYRFVMDNRPFMLNATFGQDMQLCAFTEDIAGEILQAPHSNPSTE